MIKLKSLILFNLLSIASAANILVILGVPCYSHELVHLETIEELLRRGHNLTVFGMRLQKIDGYENITQRYFTEFYDLKDEGGDMLSLKLKAINTVTQMFVFERKFRKNTALSQLEQLDYQSLFLHPESNHFDLIITECMVCTSMFLAEIYNCPVIRTSAVPLIVSNNIMIGNYANTVIHPEIYDKIKTHGKSNYAERIYSSVGTLFLSAFDVLERQDAELFTKQKFPNLTDKTYDEILMERAKMMYGFANVITTSIRPTVPSYQGVGFVHIKLPKPLDPDLEITKFVDSAKEGLIVVTFGTLAYDFSEELFVKFAKTFESIPYKILWKADKTKYPNVSLPKNVLTAQWLPVADILAHPNVKLVIHHAGMRTIEESVDRMVPMVLFPFSYDQPFNAQLMAEQQIAKIIDLNNFTPQEVIDAVHEMMKEKYKENIKRFRALVYDQISSSIENMIDNIELTMKHNDMMHWMDYEARGMNFRAKLFLDTNFMLFFSISGIFVIGKLIIKLFRFL